MKQPNNRSILYRPSVVKQVRTECCDNECGVVRVSSDKADGGPSEEL